MKREYKQTKTTISYIYYHFVFCSRCKRKIFKIEGVEERFRELTEQICREHDLDILALDCRGDHVYLHIAADPMVSIPDIMKAIKKESSRILKEEFSDLAWMPSVWTRNYFVSVANRVSQDDIDWYVMIQK